MAMALAMQAVLASFIVPSPFLQLLLRCIPVAGRAGALME
jgi:hypothetical protein